MTEVWKMDESSGQRVTNTDVSLDINTKEGIYIADQLNKIEPPDGWTNDYEEVGGDQLWSPDFGEVTEMARGYGLQGTVKPIIGMDLSQGNGFSLFEIGSRYFLFESNANQLLEIKSPTDLQTIVSAIGDEGLGALQFEPFSG
jgi:hypothetical protein